MLVQRMRAVAHRAEPVECRHAQRGGEVAVGAAAGTALLQGDASLDSDAPRHLEQLDDGRGAFERRPLEAAGDFDRRAGNVRLHGLEGRRDTVRIRARIGARVDDRARFVGYHVGAGPALDHANGHGHAVGGILQVVDGRDLASQLTHRAHSLAWIEPGMRRHPSRDQFELADALAARFQRAAGQRRLEHQHRLAARRLCFNQRTRGAAADFLVGGP